MTDSRDIDLEQARATLVHRLASCRRRRRGAAGIVPVCANFEPETFLSGLVLWCCPWSRHPQPNE